MQCYIHSDKEAVAMCTVCNSTVCEECRVMINGRNICKNCLGTSTQVTQNTNGSIDVSMTTVSKLVTWIAIIFSSLKILEFGFHSFDKLVNVVFKFNFSLPNLSWTIYDLLFLISFGIFLIVNLSKVIKVPFITDDNIGAISLLPIALMSLAIIIVTIFTPFMGIFFVVEGVLGQISLITPIACSLASIFGLYKHKLNLNFTY